MSKCKACEAEFEKEHPEDELCGECENECVDGGEIIILGKGDAALVIREDLTKDMFLPSMDSNTPVSDATYIIAMFACLLHDKEKLGELVTHFDKTIREFEETTEDNKD